MAKRRKPPMTYDDVADFYKEKTGKNARIQPMWRVMTWLEKQPEVEYDEKNDVFRLKEDVDVKPT